MRKNRILVPTNFSKQAEIAFKQSVFFSSKTNSDIFVLHVIPSLRKIDGSSNTIETIQNKADSLIDPMTSFAGGKIHTRIETGKVITQILNAEQELKPDYIFIGTDNVDIVLNELDALVNIDLNKRIIKENHTKLNLIRLGTSGGLQEDLDVDTFLMSEMAIGFDGLLNFYKDREKIGNDAIEDAFIKHMAWNPRIATPYFANASESLMQRIDQGFRRGYTISAPGFYGPQGRELRLKIQDANINDKIRSFRFEGKRITNYEMESSALFGLAALLGHNAATVCVIIANRYAKQYSKDYKPFVQNLIKIVLDNLAKKE